jgi:hypothetical protein
LTVERFSKREFDALSELERHTRCEELGQVLVARIKDAPNFHSAVASVVSDLRGLGHDLWSFDESDDMEAWCPDYSKPSGPGLVITLYPDDVDVAWSKN